MKMLFESDAPKPGSGGNETLWFGNRQTGGGRLDHTVPVAFTSCSGTDIGRDNGLVVDRAYEDMAPYAFTGTVRKVVFDLRPASIDTEMDLHGHAALPAVAGDVAG